MAHNTKRTSVTRKAHLCGTEGCGSTWYTREYAIVDGKSVPVWQCVNCNYTESRQLPKWMLELRGGK